MSSPYWSDLVQRIDPYVPGEQPKVEGLVKLNTNESPYPPSPNVIKQITKEAIDNLRLYPDPSSSVLKSAIANNLNVGIENVFVGNGSDEVLAFTFQAFFKHNKPLLFPDITYGFYPVYCGLYDIDFIQVPLAEDFSINLNDYRQANGGIIFPNPNAPTGIGMELDAIEAILQSNKDSLVVVDEAYVDFGSDSAVTLVDRYPNLLVVQTLSKSRSLAGIRVGFAVGSAELVEGLERIKNSFNPYSIDRIAGLAATQAIEDTDYFDRCCQKTIATREQVAQQLESLGFEILPSKANFLMVKPKGIAAADLFAQLRERKILVRYFSKPRIDAFLRVSIGTDEEMTIFIDAVKEILA
jgi:histidinol-phosphate aminotransferase